MIALFTEEEDNPFITDELLQLGPGDKYLFCHPGVLLYYLMFIYYHRLNDISRRQDCLHDLMVYVTTESTKFSPIFQCCSLFYLKRAFLIISYTDAADNCSIMIRALVESQSHEFQ